MAEKTSLEEVNGLDRGEFVAGFGGIYEHSPWVAEAVYDARPFGGLDELHAAMVGAVNASSEGRKMALIRAHPDLAGKAAVAGELTPESAGEQSSAGLDGLTPEEFEVFMRMNRAYHERFGMPMIVCVREHDSRESILKNAKRRLDNSQENEVEVALAEIHKIARLRLEDLFREDDERGVRL